MKKWKARRVSDLKKSIDHLPIILCSKLIYVFIQRVQTHLPIREKAAEMNIPTKWSTRTCSQERTKKTIRMKT